MARPAAPRLILRKVLSLPTPILRLMSGGGVVYQGGRTLDPRLQFLAAQARNAPPVILMTPEEARRANAQFVAAMSGDPEPGVATEYVAIEGPGGAIPARAYRPEVQDPAAPLMDWFMGHYLGPGDDPANPRLSPLRQEDLSGLAPALVITAGFDPLVDQGEAYARALKDAGVPVIYRCYDGLAHAFTALTGAVPAADVACREIAGLVREGFEGRIT